jgi:hypothetical protein
MTYKAIRLNKNNDKHYVGSDLEFTYYIVDENDNIVYNLSSFTFSAKLYSDADSGYTFDQATYMTVSGEKIILSIPNSLTTSFMYEQRYVLELQGTISSKINTLLREEIFLKRELL